MMISDKLLHPAVSPTVSGSLYDNTVNDTNPLSRKALLIIVVTVAGIVTDVRFVQL